MSNTNLSEVDSRYKAPNVMFSTSDYPVKQVQRPAGVASNTNTDTNTSNTSTGIPAAGLRQ